MTRLFLLGGGSFIAQAVASAASKRHVACIALGHGTALDSLSAADSLLNFSLTPTYRGGVYEVSEDCDLKAARAAADAGAWFGMLSTRRVYGPQGRWNAAETASADGDETQYGRNKARTEKAVLDVHCGGAGIFRLSNIFGYEYVRENPRKSFLGTLLASLKKNNTIRFDMSPATRRDFLPVEVCADLLVDRALARTTGTYNLGSGLGLACGELAGWICEGYEGGALRCDPDLIRDEFCLNMDKWCAKFSLPVNKKGLRDYCVELGRRLKCEKF